jgi:hypothetical protein
MFVSKVEVINHSKKIPLSDADQLLIYSVTYLNMTIKTASTKILTSNPLLFK